MSKPSTNPYKVLVVAAHPDDEVLGCGGTLVRHAKEGAEIFILFLTDGVGSRDPNDHSAADDRRVATNKAMDIIGVTEHSLLDFPDNALDRIGVLEVTKAVEQASSKWGTPNVIYTHHPGDLNVDHRIAYEATMTCFRPQPMERAKPTKILMFEVVSSTGWRGGETNHFSPNYYIDISSTLSTKVTALEAYSEEMRPWPHARSLESVKHLAKMRGSTIGVDAAEAFQVARIVDLES